MRAPARSPFVIIAACAALSCAAPLRDATVTGDYLSGRVAAGANDVAAAADAYGDAVKAAPGEVEIVREAFFYHLAAGEIEQAAPYARRLLADETPPDDLARLTLAAIAMKSGDLDAARGALAGKYEEPFAETLAYLANVWIELGRSGPEAAIGHLAAGGPGIFKGFAPTFQAIFEEEAGDMEAARAAHELSISSFGGPVGRQAYGAFLERVGDVAAATEFYRTLAKDPGPSRRLAEAGLTRIAKGSPSKAYTDLSPAEGTALALYLFAGNILEQSAGERQRAFEAGFNVGQPRFNFPLALAQIAVFLDPDFAAARRMVGNIMVVYGNYDRAREMLSAIPPHSPQFEQAAIDIAGALVEQKRAEQAISVLENAIDLDPLASEARLGLAGILADENRHEAAIAAATAAIDRLHDKPFDDAWRYYVTRAASAIELGRWKEAEADLKRAVDIAPEEPTALNFLGYSWVERGENLDEAFKLIEKALALRPQSGAITDSLGWAHYQLGDYEAAVPLLEEAAALEPGDATITDHLGDVYWRLGRMREARFQWSRALELEPDEELQAALARKLKAGLEPGAEVR